MVSRGILDHEQLAWDSNANARKTTAVHNDGSSVTSSNPFPVNVIAGSTNLPSETHIEFQQVSTVPKDTLTTVLSFNNTLNILYINEFEATGTVAGQWFLYINNNLKLQKRTTASQMNLNINMYKYILNNGDVLDVKVEHYNSNTQEFVCSMKYER